MRPALYRIGWLADEILCPTRLLPEHPQAPWLKDGETENTPRPKIRPAESFRFSWLA